MNRTNYIITNFFTLWIVLFSVIAFFFPQYFKGLTSLIVPTLGIIMFGMGMTLEPGDFMEVFTRPGDIAVGVFLQYAVMPLAGFIIAELLGLEPLLAVGVVLLGSCPGGTASNVITYLAKGDVALSVTLTSVSTLLCPVLIPLLMYIFARQWIDVPVYKLFISSLQIVIIPVALGLLARSILRDKLERVLNILPSVSAAAIIFIVAVIVASNTDTIIRTGAAVVLAVVIHNFFGLSSGYYLARIFGMDVRKSRAVAIEVGMQNSGLAVALASKHFGALAALPPALFSIWHNVSGSVLAWWWRRKEAV